MAILKVKIFAFALIFNVSTLASAETFVFTAGRSSVQIVQFTSIVSKAYRSLGHDIEVNIVPAKRALLEAKHNENVDGLLVRVKEAERLLPSLIRIPVPIIEVESVAVTKQPGFRVDSIDDLENYRVGAVRGVVLTDHILKRLPVVIYTDDIDQGMRMLKRGRIDVFIAAPKVQIEETFQKTLGKTIHTYSLPAPSTKLYHFIHRRHSVLVPSISKALSDITGNPIEDDCSYSYKLGI